MQNTSPLFTEIIMRCEMLQYIPLYVIYFENKEE